MQTLRNFGDGRQEAADARENRRKRYKAETSPREPETSNRNMRENSKRDSARRATTGQGDNEKGYSKKKSE